MKSYEQKARDMLERCGWYDAQQCTACDVVEVANLLVERDRLKQLLLLAEKKSKKAEKRLIKAKKRSKKAVK